MLKSKYKFLQEFKKFAIKGNVIDLAVGVIIGTAFGKIVSSLVSDIMMPIIGLAISGVDFSDLTIIIKAATEHEPAVAIKYGAFIQTIINFLIIAFSIFMMVKAINKLQETTADTAQNLNQDEKENLPKVTSEQLLTEIRDLLKIQTTHKNITRQQQDSTKLEKITQDIKSDLVEEAINHDRRH